MSAPGNTTTTTTTTTTATTTTPTTPTGDPKQHVKSHSGRRQSRNKKQPDPFLDLPDDVLKQAAAGAASTPSPKSDNQPPHSLLVHLFFTPISVISFILSLFLIERQQRQWRYQQQLQLQVQQQQQNPTTAQSQSGRWLLSGPEPYQESPETTWHPRLSWRRRGIAKMQISDVLEMKGRVAVALAVWMAVAVGVCAYGIRWLWGWMI
ncbi:hypothetical protein SMMN14_07452 [Sphaerulina musiva]